MKLKVCAVLFTLMLFNICNVYATDAGNIVCTADVSGTAVCISGQLPVSDGKYQVTLLVGDTVEEAVRISQTESDADGSFVFEFTFSDDIPKGQYKYTVTSVVGQYSGVIEYKGETTEVTNSFFDADVTVNISNYVPTISGQISCEYGKTVDIAIVNHTNNAVIADEEVTYDDGTYNMSYQLPNLLNPKVYSVIITCSDGEQTQTVINFEIDSSIVLVSLSGNVQVADNVELSVLVESTNTDLVDSNSIITESKSISATIPNIVSNSTFHLVLQGIETVDVAVPDYENTDIDGATEIATNQTFQTAINSSLSSAWFKLVPKYSDIYSVITSDNFDVELIEVFNGVSKTVEMTSSQYMSYPKEYYFKATSKAANGGTLSLTVSLDGKTSGKAFETTVGSDVYYSNIKDNGRIYVNDTLFTNTEALKGVTWLCSHNGVLYFNAESSICRLTDTAYEVVGDSVDARYIISDGSYLYFSNWSDSGRIYRASEADDLFTFEKVCDDSASWIAVDGDYLYYKNGLDGNKAYRVQKTAQNMPNGELVE